MTKRPPVARLAASPRTPQNRQLHSGSVTAASNATSRTLADTEPRRTSMDPGGALLTTQARLKLSFALSFFRLLTGLTQPHERDRLNRAGKGKVMRIGSNG